MRQRNERARHQVEYTTDTTATSSESRWYGWQTLTADGIAIGVWAVGAVVWTSRQRAGGLIGGTATYGLGAPLVHTFNGHLGKGLLSLGIRTGALATATGALLICTDDCDSGVPLALAILSVPVILDGALLARHPRPKQPSPPTSWTLQPTLGFNRRILTLGLQGSF